MEEISDKHPCPDERCAIFITRSDDPFVCIHYDNNAEAIYHWGRVARGELDVEDVIEPYRDYLDFSEATSLADHYDSEQSEWTGPTVDIEVRVDHEPVKTFTAYPHDGGLFPSFSTALQRADGYADACYDILSGENPHFNAKSE